MTFAVLKELECGKLRLEGEDTLELSVVDWGHKRLFVRMHIDGTGFYFGLDLDAEEIATLIKRLETAKAALAGAQAEKDAAK